MPNTSSQDIRLRISPRKLKQKLVPEADELLRQILSLEDDRMKTDILRSLIGDSLNRFFDAHAPSFSHFAIRNAFGVAPAPQTSSPAPEASKVATGNPVAEAQAAFTGAVGQSAVPPQQSSPAQPERAPEPAAAPKSVVEAGDAEPGDGGAVDEDWQPNPQFASFIQ